MNIQSNISRILLISLCCYFLGSALFFGVVSGWQAMLFSPVLSIFGWFYYPLVLIYVAFAWRFYNPKWNLKYKVLFVLICTAMGMIVMPIIGIGEVGSELLWRTAYFLSSGISAGIGAFMVTHLKKRAEMEMGSTNLDRMRKNEKFTE